MADKNNKIIVINGENAILGRLASYAAKKALEGYTVYIVNAEKVAITGNKDDILRRYLEKIQRGDPHKGPFFPRQPHLIVRRTIRGMLPWKKKRGREAYRRVKVFIGFPEELKKYEVVELDRKYKIEKLKIPKFIYLGELSRLIGGKW